MLTAHRGRFVAGALLAGALALTAAGCGSNDDDKAAAPPTTAPATNNTTSTDPSTPPEESSGIATTPAEEPSGDSSTPAGDLPSPCKGVTEADVTGWTGLPVQKDETGNFGVEDPYNPGDTQRECAFGIKGGHLLMGTGRTSADIFSPPGEAETVTGIGDQAYFIKANNELHVRKDTLEVIVNFTKDSSPEDDVSLIPAQKIIATRILEIAGV
ncbi:hypothetical protein [Kribbella sp. NPDC055071]